MPTFEWVCRDCKIFWDRECSIGKAPDRTRCPKCKSLSPRFWQNENVGVSFKDDKDFHTVRQRYKKVAQDGYDKDSANRFLRRHIEASKNAAADESFRYKPMQLNYEKLAEDGKAKKLTDKQVSEKIERSKKLTIDAYDRANKMGYKDIGKDKLDITKPQKQ
jgi:hypothetical protein